MCTFVTDNCILLLYYKCKLLIPIALYLFLQLLIYLHMKIKFLLLILLINCSLKLSAQWTDIYPGTIPNPVPIYAIGQVKFFDNNTGYALSRKGLQKTVDGGANWQYLDSSGLANVNYWKMFFADSATVFTYWTNTSGYGLINKSIDGGNTFSTAVFNYGFNSAWFFDADTGFVATNGHLYRTYNGGQTVVNCNIGSINSGQRVDGLFFLNRQTGFVYRNPGQIYKTTDGGISWSLLYNGFGPEIRSMYFTDAFTGYATDFTLPGGILKTTDGGLTWNNTILQGGSLSNVYFTSTDTGYAFGQYLFRTTDAGAHWYGFSHPQYSLGAEFSAIDNNTLFFPAWTDGIVKSTNAAFTCMYNGGISDDTIISCINDNYHLQTNCSHPNPYLYTWSPPTFLSSTIGDNTYFNSNVQSDTITYTVTVTDTIFGCPSITDSVVVITDASNYVYSNVLNPNMTYSIEHCFGDTVLIDLGQGAISYLWDDGDINRIKMITDTLVTYHYGSAYACSKQYQFYYFLPNGNCDTEVYPGDCNNDLICNAADLLPIGLNYGKVGFSRPNATLQWLPQEAAFWQPFNLPQDEKYADTNGDGIIDLNDVAAINLNYGLTHPARQSNQTNATTNISIVLSNDTVAPLQSFYADVVLSGLATDSIYGISFSLGLDYNKIDFNNIQVSTQGSFMGIDSVDMVSFNRPMLAANELNFAVTGIDVKNRSANGMVVRVYLKALGATQIDSVNFTLTSVTGNNAVAQNVLINSVSSILIIDPAFTGISSLDLLLHYIPSLIDAELPMQNKAAIEKIKIYDASGKLIFSSSKKHIKESINTSAFQNGLYNLQIEMLGGSVGSKKFIVMHQLR